MNEQWIADAVFAMQPWWLNLFESTATVQFVHRWVGAVLLLLGVIGWSMAMAGQSKRLKVAASITLTATLIQFGIGIMTLIHVIPLGLASLHQAWACVVLLSTVYLIYVTQGVRVPAGQAVLQR